jgi:hypothetical protein
LPDLNRAQRVTKSAGKLAYHRSTAGAVSQYCDKIIWFDVLVGEIVTREKHLTLSMDIITLKRGLGSIARCSSVTVRIAPPFSLRR